MQRFVCLLFINILFLPFQSKSQVIIENELFGSAGSSLSNSTCQLSFSIGETVTSSFQLTNLLLTQGFQQPMKWKSTNNLAITDLSYNGISIYPNPFLTDITIINENNLHLNCRLYDLTNRLIYQFEMNEQYISIKLTDLPAGTYHLVFTNSDFNHFTLPIIKIN
jgi:hypothetical protein